MHWRRKRAVAPVPTTSNAVEYVLEVEGQPAVSIVDTPGFDERRESAAELVAQAERADLIPWVASATRPDSNESAYSCRAARPRGPNHHQSCH
jgi:hypothetical protein